MSKLFRLSKDRVEPGYSPPAEPGQKLRLGERLLRANLITQDQLHIALHEQRRSGKLLGAILVQLGFISDADLSAALAEQSGFGKIDLKSTAINPELMQRLPKIVAERCRAVPVRLDGHRLSVAMADPYDVVALDEIRRYFPPPFDLVPLIAGPADIAEVITRYEGFATSLEVILKELETGDGDGGNEGEWQHPVVRLVNTLLFDAVKRGASDIHFEPESSLIRLRYRIDGALQQVRALHRSHWPELSHRLKIMAGMNIADQRSLQDGRFRMRVGGADIDFRMAVMPTVHGENIVVRILDHRCALQPLNKLGYQGSGLARLERILERPEGIVLVTGPTGCGKTTTLYSILARLSSVDVNIMTLEEPVEYQFNLIRQTSVQEAQGLTFAEGVRGILRQDPDIVFIGEVRDNDTAKMSLRAAMTGHKVFSTLHCNDALGALPRLIDLGLNPSMLAENISGILAQRLVRKLCDHCKCMRQATAEEWQILRRGAPDLLDPGRKRAELLPASFAEAQSPILVPTSNPPQICEPVGCPHCHGTGYKGRVAIAEIVCITPAIDELIAAGATRSAIAQEARADGFRGMGEHGVTKILTGEISLDGLRRAVDLTRTTA